MLKILRETEFYQYDTPTKRKCISEWLLTNPDPKPVRYLKFFAEEVLPNLKVTDSKNRLLHVLPTSLINKKTLKQAETLNVHPIVIQLREEIEQNEIETVRMEYITAYSLSEVLRRKFLIGYTHYEEEIVPVGRIKALKDVSVYFGIFTPERYKLSMQAPEEAGEMPYRDESSVIFRWFPIKQPITLSWDIRIPDRILIWLMLGLGFGIFAPILALILYAFTGNFIASSTLIVATAASILTMRAWLFYSVELLDFLNHIYVGLFIFSVGALCFLYYLFSLASTVLLN